MRTIHQQMLHEIVNEHCAQDSQWVTIVSRVLRLLMEGHWEQPYVDSLVQKWSRYEYDIYDAYAFAQCHAALRVGSVLHATVRVAAGPRADKQVSENNRMLKQLPAPFFAQFRGNNQDDDGFLAWHEPVLFHRMHAAGQDELTPIPPSTLPLEIGYTDASRTLLHFAQERGVARWPYGSDTLHLYKVIDDALWSPVIQRPPLV